MIFQTPGLILVLYVQQQYNLPFTVCNSVLSRKFSCFEQGSPTIMVSSLAVSRRAYYCQFSEGMQELNTNTGQILFDLIRITEWFGFKGTFKIM